MRRIAYYSSATTMLVIAVVFYFLQNNYLASRGGSITLAKALWPGICLFYWLVLPVIIICDKETQRNTRWLYTIFLASMLIRGVAEIIMMYVTKNWHPYIGISHDIFSLILIFGLILWANNMPGVQTLLINNLKAIGLMFIPEISFAWYFLKYLMHGMAHTEGKLFFVPGDMQYLHIILHTWLAIAACVIWQIIFARRWLYEKT